MDEAEAVEARIQELRALTEAAAPGPWVIERSRAGGADVRQERANGYVIAANTNGEYGGGALTVSDAEFVSAAREAVPWLLDQLEAARAAIQRVRDLQEDAVILPPKPDRAGYAIGYKDAILAVRRVILDVSGDNEGRGQ
ncbi:MAG TPA: hypothetical protein VFW64_12130 [Pseudonocardiaceae bacterium]|nr:hypothetical protein [Pseudonocardiaceae bacterium]